MNTMMRSIGLLVGLAGLLAGEGAGATEKSRWLTTPLSLDLYHYAPAGPSYYGSARFFCERFVHRAGEVHLEGTLQLWAGVSHLPEFAGQIVEGVRLAATRISTYTAAFRYFEHIPVSFVEIDSDGPTIVRLPNGVTVEIADSFLLTGTPALQAELEAALAKRAGPKIVDALNRGPLNAVNYPYDYHYIIVPFEPPGSP